MYNMLLKNIQGKNKLLDCYNMILISTLGNKERENLKNVHYFIWTFYEKGEMKKI